MVPFLGDKPFVFKLSRDQLCASVSEDLILCGWNDILHGQMIYRFYEFIL